VIMKDDDLVQAEGVTKHYSGGRSRLMRGRSPVRAVDGVDLGIRGGETLGLVGESGCGKSTLGRLLLHLVKPTAGEVRFAGRALGGLGGREMRRLRADMQLVFQDPMSSLDPRMTVGDIVGEGLKVHRVGNREERRERVQEMLHLVGLPEEAIKRLPSEFSGGQRQRVSIARALALRPKLVVADEPVSALDVSIQAQVLNLLADLKNQFELTMLFIAHDLAVVSYVSDRVAVMYLGRIVELAPTTALYEGPLHPYTRILLDTIPRPRGESNSRRLTIATSGLDVDVDEGDNLFTGCRFRNRCPMVERICAEADPPLRELGYGHWAACHFAEAVRSRERETSPAPDGAG